MTFLVTSVSANIRFRTVLQAVATVSSEFPISRGLEERRPVSSGKICFAAEKMRWESSLVFWAWNEPDCDTSDVSAHPWRSAHCCSETCYWEGTWPSSVGSGSVTSTVRRRVPEPPTSGPESDSWHSTPGPDDTLQEMITGDDPPVSTAADHHVV